MVRTYIPRAKGDPMNAEPGPTTQTATEVPDEGDVRRETTGGLEFFASCPSGFEQLLADELSGLRIQQLRPLRGQVGFVGGLEDAYRACLWSRIASRVVLVLARVSARDADALYQGISEIPWEEQLLPSSTVAVDAHGTNSQLRNTQFVAVRAKDAIVDRMLARTGARPDVDTSHPDLRVVVRVSRERATVGIDLSGEALFRRGYEAARSPRASIAPLRPDYAAALLAAGGWFRSCRRDDPTLAVAHSGAGTLVVEAAAQALDRAPGLLRRRWGFQGWLGHDEETWQRLLAEAQERAELGQERVSSGRTQLVLLASEARKGALDSARQALRAAGMDVELRMGSLSWLQELLEGHCSERKGGFSPLLVADLSWLAEDEVAVQASSLADVVSLSALADDRSRLVVLAKDATVDSVLGASPASTSEVYVGQDRASVRVFSAEALGGAARERPQLTLPDGQRVPVLVPASDQFAARLAKVARLRRKWARREDVSCYRVYDADLPDYAVTIDLFQGSELMPARKGRGRWLQVFEYAPPKSVDPALARMRLLDVLAIAPRVLDVRPEDCFVRVRTRARGGSQYADEASAGQDARRERVYGRERDAHARQDHPRRPTLPKGAHLVDEGGLTFEVSFSTRLDCGLFLDNRETRAMLREMSKKTEGSKRFLNLFAYTGSATCYAADGGAKHTTTVDMSRPSLGWARRNMERNGFDGPEHEFVQADVIGWVSEQRRTANRWDLVFCDVPTFSNSNRMRGSWDVQRDHAELLIGLSRILTRNGRAVFCCNLRDFRPDVEKLRRYGVELEDVTTQTIPEDFSRNQKVHHCYVLRRVATESRA